ncbi:Pol protein [Phytophthora cinnamomi]|uniref:Pol protein n=1 Tax=Phytophthora cinnamomi TaxID=4785 RepID=UPI003559D283|nr:Pol protein [Phytophthora cinnamomi]
MAERTRVPSNLPKFTGNSGDDVREWLFQIENACRINGIQIDDASVRLPGIAGSAMEKPTSGWFLHYVKLENPETLSEAMDLAVKYEVTHFVEDVRDRPSRQGKRKISAGQVTKGVKPFKRKPFVTKGASNLIPRAPKIAPAFTARSLATSKPTASSRRRSTRRSETGNHIDWRSRRIEGRRTKTLHWKRAGETCKPIEEGRPVIASRLRKSVEAKGLSVKRPDFCRGAALETDVKLKVETTGDAVQKEKTLSVVRGQQEDAQAGKDSAGQSGVATSKRESTARATDERSGTRGKDTIVEMMFTMGIVDESGVQTKYITRKKPRKFLRIKTKKIDEPDLMLVLSIETIKQVVRSLQRCDEPDNVGSAKALCYLETDWDTFLENPAFDLLTEYKDNVFRSELPEGLPEKREIEYRIGVKDPNLVM